MNYTEALDYILTKLPMYQRIGKAAYRADLSTSHQLDRHLNYPHRSFKSVHVAGTNGKGSVCHMLASVLQEAGYKVGLHTSPHYTDFRERIKVNGEMISEKAVSRFVEDNMAFFEEIKPSFFEMSVFMAFWYFARQQVDIAIVEVGMGGRLDSTNVITPVLSVITNIGLDHTQFLGDTLEKIAGEKAGIIKEKVPVVVGETQAETTPVFREVARKNQTKVVFADQQIELRELMEKLESQTDRALMLQHQPAFRLKNIRTVYAAVEALRNQGVRIQEEAFVNGIRNLNLNTGFMGRWQVLREKPMIICDSGHNISGLQMVVDQLKQINASRYFIILGFVNDKDILGSLKLFPLHWNYIFTRSSVERAMPAEQLQKIAKDCGLLGKIAGNVDEALKMTIEAAGDEDVVFVGGSSFLVADVLGGNTIP